MNCSKISEIVGDKWGFDWYGILAYLKFSRWRRRAPLLWTAGGFLPPAPPVSIFKPHMVWIHRHKLIIQQALQTVIISFFGNVFLGHWCFSPYDWLTGERAVDHLWRFGLQRRRRRRAFSCHLHVFLKRMRWWMKRESGSVIFYTMHNIHSSKCRTEIHLQTYKNSMTFIYIYISIFIYLFIYLFTIVFFFCTSSCGFFPPSHGFAQISKSTWKRSCWNPRTAHSPCHEFRCFLGVQDWDVRLYLDLGLPVEDWGRARGPAKKWADVRPGCSEFA